MRDVDATVAVDPPLPRIGDVSGLPDRDERDDRSESVDYVARADRLRLFQHGFPRNKRGNTRVMADSNEVWTGFSRVFLGGARLFLQPGNAVTITPCSGRDLCCRVVGDVGSARSAELHVITVTGSLREDGSSGTVGGDDSC